MTLNWREETEEEKKKREAEQQVMEMFARLAGRTMGVKLPNDK